MDWHRLKTCVMAAATASAFGCCVSMSLGILLLLGGAPLTADWTRGVFQGFPIAFGLCLPLCWVLGIGR